MTPIIIIAIGLLGTIFMASFVALLIVCKHKHSGRVDFTVHRNEEIKQDVELIAARDATSVELSRCIPDEELPEMFLDPDWRGDPENLVAHCVTLLKTCHQLTERLVAYTMENVSKMKYQEKMAEIVAVARQIGPKVDDVVNSMYMPSDFKQIEEKSSALYESVCKLLQVIKNSSTKPKSLEWADEMVTSIRKHIELMEADSKASWEHSTPTPTSTPSPTANMEFFCECNKPVMSSLFTNRAYCS